MTSYALIRWMRVAEVARRLDVSENAIYNAINRGELKVKKVGRVIRISEEQYAEYVAQAGTVAA